VTAFLNPTLRKAAAWRPFFAPDGFDRGNPVKGWRAFSNPSLRGAKRRSAPEAASWVWIDSLRAQ
jgi:hypothetical protein